MRKPLSFTVRQLLRDDERESVTLRAEVQLQPDTVNETERSVEAVFATETRATVFDLRNWRRVEEILVIEGGELPPQIPLLDSHPQKRGNVTTDDIRGSGRSLRIERRQLVGKLFFADDEDSNRLWGKVRGKHVTDLSVGVEPLEQVELQPGTTQIVAGKKYKAGPELPLLITLRWRPTEVSACVWGADPKSKIRTEGQPPRTTEIPTVPVNLRAYLESIGLVTTADEGSAWDFYHNLRADQFAHAETLRGNVTAPARRTPAPTNPAPTPPAPNHLPSNLPPVNPTQSPDVETIRSGAITAERQRVQRIEELGGNDVPRETIRQAITEGWDEARASREFLQIVRTRRTPAVPGAPAIHTRSHETDCTLIALEAACLLRANLDPVNQFVRYHEGSVVRMQDTEERRQEVLRAADLAWRYRDLSMVDICREALRLDQRNCPDSRSETIRTAMSGSSLTNIFTTTVGAQLLAAYEVTVDTTVGWVREAEVPNFQTNERVKLGKGGRLQKLARGKKAAHANRGDGKEEYKIGRYAEQFVADEQDFIDDNFGALLDMPEEFGEAARQVRPDLVYAILLANDALQTDNIALFEAVTHKNLRTSAALAGPTLKTAITDMSTQQEGGRNLNLPAFALLVPKALKHTGNELINSAETRDTTANKERGTRNSILDDNLTLISDSRLDNGVIDPNTDTLHAGSSTTWFLVTRGGRYTIEVGYLRGTGRAPQLRSFVLNQGQWGMGWDINLDIGAKALDFRGLHKNTG